MGDENKPEQFLVLTDAWRVVRNYVDADQDKCEQAICDVDAMYKRYNTDFAKEIALACINEIDRIIKANSKRGGK